MTVMGLLGAAAPGLWGGLRVAAPLWGAWEEGGAGGSLLRPHPAPLPPSRLIPKLRVPHGFPGGSLLSEALPSWCPPGRKGEQVAGWEWGPWVGHQAQPLWGGSRGRGGLPSPCELYIDYIYLVIPLPRAWLGSVRVSVPLSWS